jgi:DNA repair photolyase
MLRPHYPDSRGAHHEPRAAPARGKDYRAEWGTRMRGTGVFADIIEKRFEVACRRFGLNEEGARA